MLPADPLFHKPKSIIAAKNILYAVIFLGLVNWAIGGITGLTAYSNIRGIATIVLISLAIFLLAREIGHGKKWARTVFLVLFILGIVVLPFAVGPVFKSNLLVGVLSVFEALLQLLALVFLFSRESTHWFDTVRSVANRDPHRDPSK